MNTRYIMSAEKVFCVENGKWLDMGTWAEVAAELDALRAEVERLRGLLPDAEIRGAILRMVMWDHDGIYDHVPVEAWLSRLESSSPDGPIHGERNEDE